MKRVTEALTVVVLAGLAVLIWGAVWVGWSARPTITSTLRDVHVTVLEAGLTLKNLREASEAWKDASKQQALATSRAMSNVDAAVVRFTSFISRTDESVNSTLLPTFSVTLERQSAALLESQRALQENLQALLQATQQLQKTVAEAGDVVSDPHLKEALANLSEASQNAADATDHLAKTTEATEGFVKWEVGQLEKPASFAKRWLIGGLDVAYKVFTFTK